ncbi:hypothetical protein C8A05DRAFT_44249 [Staphylotrichum tortipilum]|uniref:NmrA-like domain-containing protein n=1 Tax=Staphylotrichum tortipilum TaxID=2831512 RepID=A0AAN6MK04_9PEZI|nr:hypothetical protein C8A05DRAFT_44249 [Staphylotrichum longicolle]
MTTPTSKKTITILGATGAQGTGVARTFLSNPLFHVRAVTRNPSSAAAQALSSLGAELVKADLNDPSTLPRALAGSHVIYGVTDFFEPFARYKSAEKAMEVEVGQGVNLARAAAGVEGLEHFIWSTLPDGRGLSEGRVTVPHFEGKNRVERYIKEKDPGLLEKTTFLWVAWYHDNYRFPMFTPVWVPSAGKFVQLGNYEGEVPISTIGDVRANVGRFVEKVVEQPGKTQGGRVVFASSEVRTAREMLGTWARVKGVEAQFVRVSGEAFRELWPLWGEEMGVMMELWDEFRERSWTDAEGREVLTKEDLGVQGLQSLEEAFKGLEL